VIIIRSAPMLALAARRFLSLIKLMIILGGGILFSACGSHSNSVGSTSTPNPTIEGPVAGTPSLLGSTSFNLATVGYQQSEYFISGTARSFTNTKALKSDGKWSVRVADEADYKTRVLVYRPIDAAAFNGTVIVEWLNVSGGTEASSEWIMGHTELIRSGYAWVGISVQKAGIDGGGINLTGAAFYLKALNPTRYGSLLHPGDKYAYDIFSQAAQAVLHPSAIDPLDGLQVERAIGSGESQSADFMMTYVNAIAPTAKLFDGYFIHSRAHGTVGLTPPPPSAAGIDFDARFVVHVRDDLNVPVMMLQTETDMFLLGAYPDRQPDTAKFRLWEVAGAAHADLYTSKTGSTDLGTDPNIAAIVEVASPYPGIIDCGKPVNIGPHHFVVNAAIAALDNWLRNGVAPASAEPLEIAGNPAAFVYDSIGNVKGGVRTPYVDAPIAKLSGEGQTTNIICSLFGTAELLDSTVLASLYPDHATFVSAVNTSVDNAVTDGFLLQPDGDLIKAWAQASTIGTP
jgi:hypothetical protein